MIFKSIFKSIYGEYIPCIPMISKRVTFVCMCLTFLCGSMLNIQQTEADLPRYIPSKGAFPESDAELYPESDIWRNFKITAEEMMGLYLVDFPRRHRSEVVSLNDKRNHIHFHLWVPIGNQSRVQLWSKAAYWLIFGRTQYAQGSRGLFSEINSLDKISLSFHEVIRPGQEGRRPSKKPDKIMQYLTLTISRTKFEKLNIEELRQCGMLLDCPKRIHRTFSYSHFNTRYYKK